MTLQQVIEALVFASQKPLLPREIVTALKSAGVDETPAGDTLEKTREAEVLAALEALQQEYAGSDRAFRLVEQASGWRIVTAPDFARWVRQLYPESKPARLSGPALETLAIIAYRQPITRADVEAIRGVAVDGMVQVLLERGLNRIAGRAEVPGRPLIYETTQFFLDHFGLRSLDELPNSSELRRIALPAAPTPAPELPLEPATVEASSAPTSPPAATSQPPSE